MEPEGFVDATGLLRSGVYMLLLRGEVVYVGQSVKLYSRIYSQCMARGKPRKQVHSKRILPGIRFDQIMFKVVLNLSDLDRVERELVDKYQPKYNTQLKASPPAMSLEMLVDMMAAPMPPPTRSEPPTQWRRR